MLISDPKAKRHVVVFNGKEKFAHWRHYYPFYLALVAALLLTIWIGQQSINAYWQQKYHQASPLEKLNGLAVWRYGATIQNNLNESYQNLLNKFNKQNEKWLTENDKQTSETPLSGEIHDVVQAAASSTISPSMLLEHDDVLTSKKITLKTGDKVVFAGDSIMQGIAPHLQRWLKNEYEIDSINLSKQSTGLAYPSFFDWPTTLEQTLKNDQQVKLLIVLFGANDPWDFPDPSKHNGIPYLKFESPEWERVYLERVNRIIQAAKQSNATVIWLGIPYMKRVQLNTQMHYLENVLSKELNGTKDNVLWLPINQMLSDGEEVYKDAIELNGKMVRIRTKDGIHFTTQGQQFLADYIASYITYQKK